MGSYATNQHNYLSKYSINRCYMRQLPNFSQSLSQLIACPSISSTQASWDQGNKEVIQLLATWFEQLGFNIEIQAVPDTSNKFNLLAKLGSGEGGLLLAGHSDTVPFDENRWQSNPHTVVNQDDKFFGLGTCDMKGFFAFILQAVPYTHLRAIETVLDLVCRLTLAN